MSTFSTGSGVRSARTNTPNTRPFGFSANQPAMTNIDIPDDGAIVVNIELPSPPVEVRKSTEITIGDDAASVRVPWLFAIEY